MKLHGSCHCQAVKFEFDSQHPVPFNLCYCSICRKVGGGEASSLHVAGKEHVNQYQVTKTNQNDASELSPLERHFCSHCASMLWVWDSRWPDLIHPFASAIDDALPPAPERTHLMTDYKPNWVAIQAHETDNFFGEYPDESIAAWHKRLGMEHT
jgi:hypothetical protein